MSELAKWDNFYVVVGSAAGALIGLQFVVLTLMATRPTEGVAEAGAAFGSPTIVHFSTALFLAALLHVPWQSITTAAVLWGVLGLVGVGYTVIVFRRMRKQSVYAPVFEDWLCHIALPLAGYAALMIASFLAFSYPRAALFGVGGATLLLLFVGIHNAWDSVSYHVLVHLPRKYARQNAAEGQSQKQKPT
jgi:hypothetical protein